MANDVAVSAFRPPLFFKFPLPPIVKRVRGLGVDYVICCITLLLIAPVILYGKSKWLPCYWFFLEC